MSLFEKLKHRMQKAKDSCEDRMEKSHIDADNVLKEVALNTTLTKQQRKEIVAIFDHPEFYKYYV